MADEIAVGPRSINNNHDGFMVAFFALLDPLKVKTVDGQTGSAPIVDNPISNKPDWVRWDSTQVAAIKNGLAVWFRDEVRRLDGDTAQEFRDRAKARYADWAGSVQSQYDKKYRKIGALLNA